MSITKKRRLLLVDDSPAVLVTLQALLNDAGYNVTTATNGREALEQLTAESFDVLVTDARMPVMDGPGLLSELRGRGIDLPVIFMSGEPLVHTGIRAQGSIRYLSKPFDGEVLFALIEELLSNSSAAEGVDIYLEGMQAAETAANNP